MIAYSDQNHENYTTSTIVTSNSDNTDSGAITYITPRDMFVLYDTRSYPSSNKFEKFLKELRNTAKIYNAQWILRNGFKLKFYPPQLNAPLTITVTRKSIRCNRKGMGLRLRRDK